ncbi:MAG: ABC transporter permease, partial [Lysinibacillus sp.]
SSLGLTMMFASFFIYLFSFIFIIYSLYAFLKKKTKSLGVFMITGASMKQIRTMIFRENMLIGGVSIVTAIVIGLIISPLFLMGAKRMLQAESFGMYVPSLAIIVTVTLFTILFLIVSKFMTRFINREEAIQLLKADVTTERLITPAPFRLLLSVIFFGIFIIPVILDLKWIYTLGLIFYIGLFSSFLIVIYLIVTQGTLLAIRILEKSPSYFNKTNMLFVSNLKAKGRSHAHLIYLLTILLLGVFLCTSVLYISYYDVKEKSESLYPYSFQYTSLPTSTPDAERKNVAFIESTLKKSGNYDRYYFSFKDDNESRIGFISVSDYNKLGLFEKITLKDNEYYVAAGNYGVLPNIEGIHKYDLPKLQFAGLEEQNILTSGLENVYYVVPGAVYKTIDLPVYKVFAYELENWTEKLNVTEPILATLKSAEPGTYLLASKLDLYLTEKFIKSIMFFIGFMLSLIFLSAAMSILYFYLQTSIEDEKAKYLGIRKIGLSVKELGSAVTKELAMLVFIPFIFANILLVVVTFGMRSRISTSFYQMTAVGITLFLLLFIVSFLIIRRSYLKKLIN